MGYGNGSDNGRTAAQPYSYYPSHTVTLTKDYYLAIFPMTIAQFDRHGLTTGHCPAWCTNKAYSSTRPCDSIAYGTLRDYEYPDDKSNKPGVSRTC